MRLVPGPGVQLADGRLRRSSTSTSSPTRTSTWMTPNHVAEIDAFLQRQGAISATVARGTAAAPGPGLARRRQRAKEGRGLPHLHRTVDRVRLPEAAYPVLLQSWGSTHLHHPPPLRRPSCTPPVIYTKRDRAGPAVGSWTSARMPIRSCAAASSWDAAPPRP